MTDDPRLRDDAAAWMARLRAPDGARHRAAFERWRAADPAHAAAFALIEAHWQASGRLAASPLARASRLSRPLWARRELQAGALALASLAAVFVGSVVRQPGAPRPLASQQLATVLGQIRTIGLPDGTRVTLDTDSAVRIRFTPAERRVELDHGRARFVVAADPGRRFVVAAGDVLVLDRGTVFDVTAPPGAVDVMLVTGAVEVRGTARAALPRPVALTPGEQVTVAAGATVAARPRAAPAGARGWTTGLLSFDRTPLADLVREANRYSATRLELAEPGLGELRITGAFRAAAPADLASSLGALFGLRAEARPDGTILLRPPAGMPPPREGG